MDSLMRTRKYTVFDTRHFISEFYGFLEPDRETRFPDSKVHCFSYLLCRRSFVSSAASGGKIESIRQHSRRQISRIYLSTGRVKQVIITANIMSHRLRACIDAVQPVLGFLDQPSRCKFALDYLCLEKISVFYLIAI